MDYKPGDFFGERALLKSEPRAANVVATSDCNMVSMDRHSVKRLLGPLEDLLKRNFEIYEKYTLPNQWEQKKIQHLSNSSKAKKFEIERIDREWNKPFLMIK